MTKLRILNGDNSLVIHNESTGTACIGQATLALVQQATLVGTNKTAGFCRYTFNTTKPVLWAFELPVGRRVGVVSVTYLSGVYTVVLYAGDTPDNDGFDIQKAVKVWAFSSITGSGSSPGQYLRKTDGTVSHDFAAPNITLALASGFLGNTVPIPDLNPAVGLGSSPYYNVQYILSNPDDTISGPYYKKDTKKFLTRAADNTVSYTDGLMFMGDQSTGTPPENSTYTDPSPYLIVSGEYLP